MRRRTEARRPPPALPTGMDGTGQSGPQALANARQARSGSQAAAPEPEAPAEATIRCGSLCRTAVRGATRRRRRAHFGHFDDEARLDVRRDQRRGQPGSAQRGRRASLFRGAPVGVGYATYLRRYSLMSEHIVGATSAGGLAKSNGSPALRRMTYACTCPGRSPACCRMPRAARRVA